MLNTRLTLSSVALLALIACCLILLALTPRPGHAAPPAPQSPSPITADDLETFLDEFFAAQLARTHTPGAVIVVVQDDAACGQVAIHQVIGSKDTGRTLP